MKRIIIFIIIILLFGCKKSIPTEPVNNIPSVSQVQINPSAPIKGEDLILSYNFSDADGDSDKSIVE